MGQGYRFGMLLAILSHISIVRCFLEDEPAPDPVLPTAAELMVSDPSRNITCLGTHTDIPWVLADEQYDGRSMQLLCADQLYGGSNTKPNFRGYCHDGDVLFGPDNMLRKRPNRYERIRLECRTRCFCNNDLENPQQQPKGVATTRRTYLNARNEGALVMTMDVQTTIRRGSLVDLLTRLYHYDRQEPNPTTFLTPKQYDVLGILKRNLIQCGGPLPSFSLPIPFDVHDFASNQELCAVQLAGGNPAANAGAYCHDINGREKVVSFADDMTPRLDWTWDGAGGEAFFLAVAVRFHCWKNCICRDRTTKPNYFDPLVRMWEYMLEKLPPGDVIPTGTGNKYPLGSSTDSRSKPRTRIQGGNSPSAACAATPGDPSCSMPWPIDILGPVPEQFSSLGLPQPPPAAGSPQDKSCGNTCSSNKDCGTDCVCRTPSVAVEEAHALGIDPVASPAFCLDIASIFGRSLESRGQVECLCNATYSAPACCQSRDGVIQIL